MRLDVEVRPDRLPAKDKILFFQNGICARKRKKRDNRSISERKTRLNRPDLPFAQGPSSCQA